MEVGLGVDVADVGDQTGAGLCARNSGATAGFVHRPFAVLPVNPGTRGERRKPAVGATGKER